MPFAVILVILSFFATQAAAVVVYDESVSGDLSAGQVLANTDLGLIGDTPSEIFGSLDGGADKGDSGPDEYDVFRFTVSQRTNADFTLTPQDPIPAAGIVIFGYEVLTGARQAEFRFARALQPGAPPLDLRLFFEAGTYELQLAPQSNTGAIGYSLIVDVPQVPAPAPLILLLTGLVGLGAARRGRKQTT